MTKTDNEIQQAKPLTNRQYAKSGGQTCPFCRGRNVEAVGGIMPDDRDGATLDVECKDCGRSWRDIYKLAAFDRVYYTLGGGPGTDRDLIVRALEQTSRNVTRAAQLLKISRKSL
jgi:hypothetical protein